MYCVTRISFWHCYLIFPIVILSSQPRDGTQVSHIAGRFFTLWATREAQISYFPFQFLSFLEASIVIIEILSYETHKGDSFHFIYLFIFISWRLITLQYCSGFCHTLIVFILKDILFYIPQMASICFSFLFSFHRKIHLSQEKDHEIIVED